MCFLLMKWAVTLNLFVECDYFKCYHEMISMGFPCRGVNKKHYENWKQSRARLIDVILVQAWCQEAITRGNAVSPSSCVSYRK